jgi:hypothetical protein
MGHIRMSNVHTSHASEFQIYNIYIQKQFTSLLVTSGEYHAYT